MDNWAERLRMAAELTLGKDHAGAIQSILAGPTGNLPAARLLARCLLPDLQTEPSTDTLDLHLLSALAGLIDPPPVPEMTHGMTGEPTGPAIEVWTEIELASVHAAWSLGTDWRQASQRAAAWLVETIQPDNATNHPWAVHVFAQQAQITGDPSFDLYAQTLLHNCMVTTGRPDEFSALILLHASAAFEISAD